MKAMSRRCNLVLSVSSAVLAILLFVGSEVVLPAITASQILDSLTLDSSFKFEKTAADLAGTSITEYIFFNVTNAYELQTATPRPSPILVPVSVKFYVRSRMFDYQLSADGNVYSVKQWEYIYPVNPSDANLTIITANRALPSVYRICGGESSMQVSYTSWSADPNSTSGLQTICAMTYAMLLAETAQLRPGGTTPNNVGLFIQSTIDEMINGCSIHLPILTGMRIWGQRKDFNVYPSHLDLAAAIAAGAVDSSDMDLSLFVGKGLPDMMGRWYSWRSFTQLNATHFDEQWFAPRVLYNNRGENSPDAKFDITGLRSMVQRAPPLSKVPSVVSAGYPPKAAPSQTTFAYADLLMLYREVEFSCLASGCGHELVQHTLYAVPFYMRASNGWLYVNGERDVAGACASSGTCDFGMLADNFWPGAEDNIAYALPYFGNSNSAIRSAITFETAEGQQVEYDEATMGSRVWIEPFTGFTVKAREPIMACSSGFSGSVLGGGLFANAFPTPDPLPAFPLYIVMRDTEVPQKFINTLAGPLQQAYLFMLLMDVAAGLAIIFSVYKAYRVVRQGTKESSNSCGSASKTNTNKVKPDVSTKSTIDEKMADAQPSTLTVDFKLKRPPSFTIHSQPSHGTCSA